MSSTNPKNNNNHHIGERIASYFYVGNELKDIRVNSNDNTTTTNNNNNNNNENSKIDTKKRGRKSKSLIQTTKTTITPTSSTSKNIVKKQKLDHNLLSNDQELKRKTMDETVLILLKGYTVLKKIRDQSKPDHVQQFNEFRKSIKDIMANVKGAFDSNSQNN